MDMSDPDSDVQSVTPPECYATNDAFLETYAYCVSTYCPGVAVWELERFWSMNVVDFLVDHPVAKASYQQTLANMTGKEPTDTLVLGQDLNKTMIISREDYIASYNGFYVSQKVEINHETYGYVSAWLLNCVNGANRPLSQHHTPCCWIRYPCYFLALTIFSFPSSDSNQIQCLAY